MRKRKRLTILSVLAVGLVGALVLVIGKQGKEEIYKKSSIEERIPTAFQLKEILSVEKGPFDIRFSPKDEVWVAVTVSDGYPDFYTAFLVSDLQRKWKLVKLNQKLYVLALSFSPDGRYLSFNKDGIWVVDMVEKQERLITPKVLAGKLLSLCGSVLWSPDSKKYLITRVDEQINEELLNAMGLRQPMRQLNPEEEKRYEELLELQVSRPWAMKEKEWEEYYRLLAKKLPKREATRSSLLYHKLFLSEDVRVVNVESGKEEVLFKPGDMVGWSSDGQWVYVIEYPTFMLYKVRIDNPTERKALLKVEGFMNVGISPLGFIVKGVRKGEIAIYDEDMRLLKLLSYTDARFPEGPKPIPSPSFKYSFAYGKGGLFLKNLKTGQVKRIESRWVPPSPVWNYKGDKIAYLTKGEEVYEVWVYEIEKDRKTRLFP